MYLYIYLYIYIYIYIYYTYTHTHIYTHTHTHTHTHTQIYIYMCVYIYIYIYILYIYIHIHGCGCGCVFRITYPVIYSLLVEYIMFSYTEFTDSVTCPTFDSSNSLQKFSGHSSLLCVRLGLNDHHAFPLCSRTNLS